MPRNSRRQRLREDDDRLRHEPRSDPRVQVRDGPRAIPRVAEAPVQPVDDRVALDRLRRVARGQVDQVAALRAHPARGGLEEVVRCAGWGVGDGVHPLLGQLGDPRRARRGLRPHRDQEPDEEDNR
jgi:hypothetical protein